MYKFATTINDDGTRRPKGTATNDVILGTTRGDIITLLQEGYSSIKMAQVQFATLNTGLNLTYPD